MDDRGRTDGHGVSLTLANLIEDLHLGPESQTIRWPPDVFALTSRALKLTGAYRHATSVNSLEPWPPDAEWVARIQRDATLWWRWLLDDDPGLEFHDIGILRDSLARLAEHHCRSLDTFSLVGRGPSTRRRVDGECPPPDGLDAWAPEEMEDDPDGVSPTAAEQISRALLSLHALADQACVGVGVLTGKGGSLGLAHYIANSLLAETGSLATLPRANGVVLPKLRTPQVGLTLRSFSHHVTYHQSETEVVWRSLPWANIDENTLNLLVVPWPKRVRAVDFKPRLTLGKARSLGRARFFAYSPTNTFDPRMVVDYLEAAREHCERVHMVALPELALWSDELDKLKDALVSRFPASEIPLILTGVATKPEGWMSDEAVDPTTDPHRNRVVLSAYFAGDWYDLDQDKHHRWRIDDAQIQQYGLGGTLTGGTEWWEAIEIHNRRVSFLVPNGWLALTPLICEDLARLEPVSDLVRGVGPTLVVALLFDGPQLMQRWPGRYASVLADDPGSAVLSLTSLGMAARSRIMKGSTTSTAESLGNRNVALWRDQEQGWHQIELPDATARRPAHEAALLTVTAHWKTEYTADGRDDRGNAALFVLEGVQTLESVGAVSSAPSNGASESAKKLADVQEKHSDLLEVTLSTYLADALLDSPASERERIVRWAKANREEPYEDAIGRLPVRQLQERLFARARLRRHRPSDDDQASPPDEVDHLSGEYAWVADRLMHRLGSFAPSLAEGDADRLKSEPAVRRRYELIVRDCKKHLDDMDPRSGGADDSGWQGTPFTDERARRVHIGVSLLILWAVHKRISERRRSGRFTSHWADLLREVEGQLKRPMDEWVYEELQSVREDEKSAATP